MSKNDDRASRPRAVPPRVSIALGVSCRALARAAEAVRELSAHLEAIDH